MEKLEKELTFREELGSLLNRRSKENTSNTPDFILAAFLEECLNVFDECINLRTSWYSQEEMIKNKNCKIKPIKIIESEPVTINYTCPIGCPNNISKK
jgi:hypothetical protein